MYRERRDEYEPFRWLWVVLVLIVVGFLWSWHVQQVAKTLGLGFWQAAMVAG